MYTLQQVKTFILAKCSGKDKELQEERDKICNGCDEYVELPKKTIKGKWKLQGFCKACGCGAKSMADMKEGKNAYRKMTCPLKKWPGDAESDGLTLHDVNILYSAKDRTEYTLAAIQNFIDKNKPLDDTTYSRVYGQEKQVPQQSAQQAAIDQVKAQMEQQAKADPSGKVKGVADANAPKAIPSKEFERAFPGSPKAKRLEKIDRVS